MNYFFFAYTYLVIASLPMVAGMVMIRKLDKAAKIFLLMVTTSFLGELVALYTAVVYRNNQPVYNISTIIEMSVLCIYFNYIIDVFRKYNAGFFLGIISITVAVLTLIYGQGMKKENNYFMVYQGIVIVFLSLMYITQLLNKYPFFEFKHTPHYWFSLSLIFFWALTILNWAFYDYLSVRFTAYKELLNFAIAIVASITYLGFAATFLFCPKTKENARVQ